MLKFNAILFFTILSKFGLLENSYKIFFTYFIMINPYLGLFNLIPVYPLDGGQIFGNFIAKYNQNIFRKLIRNKSIEYISLIIANHLRPTQMAPKNEMPSNRALNRYYRDLNQVSIDTLYLNLSDYISARGKC